MAELTREHFDSTMRLHQGEVRALSGRLGNVEARLHTVEQHALPGVQRSQSDMNLDHYATMAGAGAAVDRLAATQVQQNEYLAQIHKRVVVPAIKGPWWKHPRALAAAKAAGTFLVAALGAWLGSR